MFEKNLNIGYLLDFYGDLLSENRRRILEWYYFEDYSLAEISAEVGISRQGVRNAIKKTEEELLFWEEKLGLAGQYQALLEQVRTVTDVLDREAVPDTVREAVLRLARLAEGIRPSASGDPGSSLQEND
jgi:predicted DNA-binding protein YlxM (UPF0122 family)